MSSFNGAISFGLEDNWLYIFLDDYGMLPERLLLKCAGSFRSVVHVTHAHIFHYKTQDESLSILL